ncbi:MAG: hypothetical protein HUJ95_01640 [Bacteroidales bacterium]|nr:hypothetical protein [Bacteroidales bacterium]
MEEKHWYIAIVGHNTEISSAEKLAALHEVFLPTQRVVSIWKDGRRKMRIKVLLPGKLLVHCTEKERLEICKLPYINRFMVDSASGVDGFGRHKIAVVPKDQIDRFKIVLGVPDESVEIDNLNLCEGERVRVITGSLKSLEGIVTDFSSPKTKLHILIDHLGCASVEVEVSSLERI